MEAPFVYVVDDEPGIAMLCERVLSRAGYRAATETNPRKAVEYFEDHSIDLLLVDIRMPEVDGFEVIQHAQRLQPDAAMLNDFKAIHFRHADVNQQQVDLIFLEVVYGFARVGL